MTMVSATSFTVRPVPRYLFTCLQFTSPAIPSPAVPRISPPAPGGRGKSARSHLPRPAGDGDRPRRTGGDPRRGPVVAGADGAIRRRHGAGGARPRGGAAVHPRDGRAHGHRQARSRPDGGSTGTSSGKPARGRTGGRARRTATPLSFRGGVSLPARSSRAAARGRFRTGD